MAAKAEGVILAKVVRFIKSRTESPEENLADRDVGKTWFGPPM